MTSYCNASTISAQFTGVPIELRRVDYFVPCDSPGGSSLGKQVRHILELSGCLQSGYNLRRIYYGNRGHDILIEGDHKIPLRMIEKIMSFLETIGGDKPLRFYNILNPESDKYDSTETTVGRELAYNIKDAVDYTAIIKVASCETVPYLRLERNFESAAFATQAANADGTITSGIK